MKKKVSVFLIILAILLAAGLLRLYGLADNPPGLWYDEASNGYDAYCLLHAGTDRYGESFPFFFRSFGDYNSGLYRYLCVPFVAVFGLSEFSVRLPSALISLFTVLLAFLLVREWYGLKTALFAALLVAISPWALPYARSGHRVMLMPFMLSLSLIAGNRIGSSRSRLWAVVTGLLFGATLYTYASARILAPIFFAAYLVFFNRRFRETGTAVHLPIAGFLVAAFPLLLYGVIHPEHVFARLLAVTGTEGAVSPGAFLLNLLRHYEPRFLFLSGDANIRHSLPGYGQLHLFEAPFLIIGLVAAFRKRAPQDLFLIAVFALFALPAALTRLDLPHGLRAIGAFPFAHIISAVGLSLFLELARDRSKAVRATASYTLAIGISVTVLAFSYLLLIRYPGTAGSEWRYGYRQAVESTESHVAAGDEVLWYTRYHRLDLVEILFYTRAAPPGGEYADDSWGAYRFRRPLPGDFTEPGKLIVLDRSTAGDVVPLGRAPTTLVNYADASPALLFFESGPATVRNLP